LDIYQSVLLIVAGFIAGFINTVAGGGSLLTMPLLIFMGLPPAVANGTNRIALFAQNSFAVMGFRSKGISAYPYSLWLSITAFFGAIVGAYIAIEIDGKVFNRILAAVMLVVVFLIVFNPFKSTTKAENMSTKHQVLGVIVFFFVGIYGGFIQAGVGFLVIAALSLINNMNLIKINSAKVFVILIYLTSSLAVFIYNDKVFWTWGLTLAIGNSFGGWIGSRWQVSKGEIWIKRVMVIMVIAMAVKLWFFS